MKPLNRAPAGSGSRTGQKKILPTNARGKKYQVTKAAKLLGVSRTKLWKMIKNDEITARPDPLDSRKKLIDEADIRDLLERRGIVRDGRQ